MTNLTFKPIHLPQPVAACDNFYLVFTLSALLSRLGDDELFSESFGALFGVGVWKKLLGLKSECEAYQPGRLPASLPILIREHLCPRLAQYIRDHETQFIEEGNRELLTQHLQGITNGRSPQPMTLKALARWLNIEVRTYSETASQLYLDQTFAGQTPAIHFIRQGGHVQGLLEIRLLSDGLAGKLTQLSTYQFSEVAARGIQPADPSYFTSAYFRRLVRQTLQQLPVYLGEISQTIPQRPLYLDYTTRSLVRPEGGATLEMRDPCSELTTLLGDSPLVRASDTQAVEIGSLYSWLGSMVKVGGTGSAAGLTGLGVSIGLGELIFGAGVGVLAIPYVGVPILVTTVLLTATIGAVGKKYAVQYEEIIRAAYVAIKESDYVRAGKILDDEFNRWFGVRAARHPYLTKEHYAIAHFFRGMSAEKSSTTKPDMKRAFEEYQTALVDAQAAGRSLVEWFLRSKILQLLMTTSPAILGMQRDAVTALLDLQLREFNERFPDSLTDLYWGVREGMARVATRFVSYEPLVHDEVTNFNTFLSLKPTQSLFMLKHYEQGRGAFLTTIFYPFFQCLNLSYFHANDPSYLLDGTEKKLRAQLGGAERQQTALQHAWDSLKKCVAQIHAFTTEHGAFIRNPEIEKCISMMQEFLLEFCAFVTAQDKANLPFLEECGTIIQAANIPLARYRAATLKLEQSSAFLSNIHQLFGKRYDTIEDWLDALIDRCLPDFELVSAVNQDTMLHVLARLPEEHQALLNKIQQAAHRMRGMIYFRNQTHETPHYLLMQRDLYGLNRYLSKHVANAETMIGVEEQIERIKTFVEAIQANPNLDGHLLLLEGPSGVGKTSVVQNYLKSKGYPIHVWARGAEKDGVVGGLNARIEEFFGKIRSNTRGDTVQIIFIDEIDAVMPKVEGTAPNGYHSKNDDVTAFQVEISNLKGHRVVMIGATNYSNALAAPILQRAGANRIVFSLPSVEQRTRLLHHFFRYKKIEATNINRLAVIAKGYAPRQLQSFVETIKAADVSTHVLEEAFNQYALSERDDFKKKFPYVDIFMPSFEKEADLSQAFPGQVELAEQMSRLQHSDAYAGILHTLLYGEPGGGKTTAVRIFAQTSGHILMSIKSDRSLLIGQLTEVFCRAKQLGRVIIFFDEIDRIAGTGMPHTGFLQTEMDGIVGNNYLTVIGATNYLDRIEPAILSRFTSKIELSRLDTTALNRPIKKALLNHVHGCGKPVYFDQALAAEMLEGATRLGQVSEELSLRLVNAAISYLMGDLKQADATSTMLYIRFQDVAFSFFMMKIQERLVERRPDQQSRKSYIQENRSSFFPADAPPHSVLAPGASLSA